MAPPILCHCGTCSRCKHRDYMRDYYHRPREGASFTSGGPVELECARCGNSFTSTHRKAAWGHRFCSVSCKNAAHNEARAETLLQSKPPRPCEECGSTIGPERRSDVKWCSDSCANKAGRKRRPLERTRWDLKQYGLTWEDYTRMFGEQGGVCAICGAAPKPSKRLAVDHCHETNIVRGLLCDSCNLAIGLMRHDAARLLDAERYLRRYGGDARAAAS